MLSEELKCLYIYDNKFMTNHGRVYSGGRVTDDVFRRYVNDKEQITVISRMFETDDVADFSLITLKNLKFKPIKGLSFAKAFTFYHLDNLKLISKEVKDTDFIVTRLPSFLGIYGLMINVVFRRKYFVEVVGDAKEALNSSKVNPSLRFKLFACFFDLSNKFFIKYSDGVIYVTKDNLQKKFPTKGYTSYASNVNIKIPHRKLTINDYKNSNTYFKLGLIGDYNNHYKGISEAIQSVKILSDKKKNMSLHILGSGSLLNYYEALSKQLNIDNLVFFEGRLNGNDAILEWLDSLDIYIQPSYSEGLPRSLIEAMSVGIPSVATNVGGIPELLDKDFLVAPHDSLALAQKIELLMQSVNLRFKQGVMNYETAKQYDSEILNERRQIFWKKCKELVRIQ